ncbi:MAG: dephospho-CoA kinase [Micrococcus sp.]|nr:dephospho-CoA kinase [Micrococcus sp.]
MTALISRVHDRLGLRTSPAIFFSAAAAIIAFTAAMGLFPGPVQEVFGVAAHWLRYDVGWFYTLSATLLLVVSVGLAISRYGRVRLGDDDAAPEYSGLAWFGMMFAAGIGAVLMFWGIAEPMYHYALPPLEGTEPFTDQAAVQALNIANFHFGLHMWAILIVPGLCFGYFTYKRKLPPRVSSAFQPLLGDRIHGPIGKAIDVTAIVSTVFGMAVSTGLGALQINAGMNYVFGTPVAGWMQAAILALITAAALTSALAGMDKGVKRLSYVNIIMAVALMLYVLMWAVSSMDVLRGVVESAGRYVGSLPLLSTFNDALGGGTWSGDWTVFYWAWTVTWAPFVGMFVAKISRGRSIREFVAASLALPTSFVVVWMGIYGHSAFAADRASAPTAESGGALTQTIVEQGNVQAALFQFLQDLPLYVPVATFALIIIVIFFVTSIDSGALVMDAMANGHEEPSTRRQKVFWAVSVGAVCAAIIVTAGDRGLDALQEVIIVIGFPVMILTVLQAFLLMQALREDAGSARPLRTRQWKRVLPAEEYRRRVRDDGAAREEFVIRPEFELGTEPEYDTHTPNTWHTQQSAARRAAVTVGLTGAVATGKSAVAQAFQRHGALVVAFDDLMREVLVPGHPVLEQLEEVFADEVDSHRGIDWAGLERLTASSPAARRRLYDVLTPVVRAEADARALEAGEDTVLVLDLALVPEDTTTQDFDSVVVIEAPVEQRVARLVAERGLSRPQAWAEIDADALAAPPVPAEHHTLLNAGSIEQLQDSVDAYWDEHIAPRLAETSVGSSTE